MYPEDSVQSLTNEWWIPERTGTIVRGRLIRTFVPYPEMKPHRLIPEDRGENARQHARATFRLEPFRIGDPPPAAGVLPVAALPLREGEIFFVQRGKVRPAVVLSTGGPEIPRAIAGGSERWQANRTLLVAPFYGADRGGTRGGWPAQFVDRIRRAEYPQYVWDQLPLSGGSSESILRLDHLFPIGSDPAGYQLEAFRLSDEALTLVDDWLHWLVTDAFPAESVLPTIREEFAKLA
ncbi:MAG: hypothetical protein HY048_04350 [Acidobacteria bacterium]|nr:hypothetical protein [Acidobacteriota bacterium]